MNKSLNHQPMPFCDAPATDRLVETVEAPRVWSYHEQSSAPGKLPIPAAFINPASVSNDLKFHCEITHIIECTGRFGSKYTTEARLSFDGLPSFSCISRSQILTALPGAVNQLATEGVSFVAYSDRVDDESGTTLHFLFRPGVQCALSASIEQRQKSGLRALRARNKSSICRMAANRRWCAVHGPVDWANGAALDQMDIDADQVCGTEDSFYRKEPASGEKPFPIARRKLGAQGCDLL